MIQVRVLGHIKTSLGAGELELEGDGLSPAELVDLLRKMSREKDPGFDRNNTLTVIGDGEAFLTASSGRRFTSGDRVVLIPFSHGG